MAARPSNAYERTVHGLTRAIDNRIAAGDIAPMVVGGLTVFGLGGPSPHHQPGPTISLEVRGRTYTATRQHQAGRVVWAVDLRQDLPGDALLAPLVAAASQLAGQALTEREAVEMAVRVLGEMGQRKAA